MLLLKQAPQAGSADETGRARVLACAACLAAVTTTDARIEVGGQHEHSFVNPHGYTYRIGCFASAPGCAGDGPSSTFWTWFPGYAWQIAYCARCGEHLGWVFRSEAHRFLGLILDRLTEVGEA